MSACPPKHRLLYPLSSTHFYLIFCGALILQLIVEATKVFSMKVKSYII